MDLLLRVFDPALLSPLERVLLVLVLVQAAVIARLWWARQRDWELWRQEAERARRELAELAAEILRHSRPGGGPTP